MRKFGMYRRPALGAILLAVLIVSMLLTEPVEAQAVPGEWSGLYGGVDIGYVAADDEAREIDGERFYIASPDGVTGALHLGWQRQFGALVAGVEAAAGYTGASDYVTRDVTGGTITSGARLGAFGSLSARLGVVPAPGWLLYGTVGAGVGAAEVSTVQTCTGADLCGGAQSTQISSAVNRDALWGPVFGAGIERRLTAQLSGRVAYQFTGYNRQLALPEIDGPGWDHEVDQHSLLLGVGYRF